MTEITNIVAIGGDKYEIIIETDKYALRDRSDWGNVLNDAVKSFRRSVLDQGLDRMTKEHEARMLLGS